MSLCGSEGLHTRFLGVDGESPFDSESFLICLLGVDGGSLFGSEGLPTCLLGVDGMSLCGSGGNSSKSVSPIEGSALSTC